MDEEINDKPLDHSYDGIQEYDNPLPGWWKNLFWATIVFSIGYCAYYMTGWGPTVPQALEMELAQARTEQQAALMAMPQEKVDPSTMLVKASLDPMRVEAGKQAFAGKCAACHSAGGEGLIGPNLTDQYWIHGGSLQEIYKVITEGVLDKGMIAWKGVMTDDEIVSVVAYIRSIQDTNKPGKAAQGEPAKATALDVL